MHPGRSSEQPRVTVVVTCYQQAHLVVDALESVARQTEPDIQLIVTDDGSADDSVEVINHWLADNAHRIRWGTELLAAGSNRGLPASLNRAMPHIRGQYFVVLNGDDWMDDDRIEVQAAALDNAPNDVGVSYCDMRVVDSNGAALVPQPPTLHGGAEGDVLQRMAESTFIGMPVVMARTSVLDTIGPWNESLVADDFDFLMRAASHFRFAYLPRTLVSYRHLGSSLTNSRLPELAEGRIRSLVAFLGRDRSLDDAILRRIEDQIAVLHGLRHERAVTGRHIREHLRRRPTRRVIRFAIEHHLRLPPRSLGFTTLRSFLPGSVMMRHRRRGEFASALTNDTVHTATSWRDLATDPNSAIALLHRARTLGQAWQQPIDDRIAHLRAMCAGKNVLDIGCVAHDAARMESPLWLHRHLADASAHCVGVDVDPAGIDAMRRAGFDAVQHDLGEGLGPVADRAPFDVIVAGELIEHVESLGLVFETARTALAPDGSLVITTPNPYAPWRVRAGQRGVVWENTDHICYVFPSGVAELAERHGLRLAHASTIDPRPARWHRRAIRAAKQRAYGSQWFLVGWASTRGRSVTRLESRSAALVRTLAPRRHPRFTGETFVYVVQHAHHGASGGV